MTGWWRGQFGWAREKGGGRKDIGRSNGGIKGGQGDNQGRADGWPHLLPYEGAGSHCDDEVQDGSEVMTPEAAGEHHHLAFLVLLARLSDKRDPGETEP